ncbi:PREDICTED: probable arabinosyltransferase ARAD1 [Brassica oleracea var. oleracea]|uniref:Exostosin GT47 domain-containing protein n=1 Tax=Brassica oleracea var. oleracea TaxID=109376 RepID=A0A0D3CMZ9_BRAOL|nr:PREDICTED: probable arabinosyltransferase ARAD1 [Brassica oleracea var. oleracea]
MKKSVSPVSCFRLPEMVERSNTRYHRMFITRISMIFLLISILSVLSWFLILSSTNPNRVLDHISVSGPTDSPLIIIKNSEKSPQQNDAELPNPKNSGGAKTEEVKETLQCNQKVSPPSPMPLKVYMYDMSPEFHFGLLGWKPERKGVVWPDVRVNVPHHPGGLNLQHSVEYWLTLDLLFSELPEDSRTSRAAIRVKNYTEADVVFVPFFSSLSYNRFSKVTQKQKQSRDRELQDKLVKFVTAQKEWKISGGKDHVIMAHHPNSMSTARHKLYPAMFVVADFGRYSPRVANVDKDIVAPYKHLVSSYANDTSGFDSRPVLLYFQGAIYRKAGGFVRQELYYLLKEEKDVYFSFGSVQNHGISKAGVGMRSSKFCLNIAGDTPSSNRLFDAIASHCIPVIISDDIELPYEDVLNYNEFCIFVRASDALKKGFLLGLVRSIGREEWNKMWGRLKEVERYFDLRFPAKDDDGDHGVQMIWKAVARKAPLVKMKVHRFQRFTRPFLI